MAKSIKIVVEGIIAAGCTLDAAALTDLVKHARAKSDLPEGETTVWGTDVAKGVAYLTSKGIGFNPVEAAEIADQAAEPAPAEAVVATKKAKKSAKK